MFDPVPTSPSFPALERDLLAFWRREEIFKRSLEESKGRPIFTFYEGPPTANGMPHWGHVETRAFKDVFLRYRSMTGYHVPRHSGWDTHGLPVEIEVEKELGIHGKADIEAMGIEAFTRKCIDSVFRYIGEWEKMSDRIGFWLDNDQGYATFHKSYVQSVWWALNTLFKQGLLYQGYKVVWWWPQGGTALSASEVGEGYRTVDDPSIVARFRVRDRERTYLLAWTTTPWTLPSNVALAVAPDKYYVEARTADGETLILAKALVDQVLDGVEHTIERTMPGIELEGVQYEPLFRFREPEGGKAWEVTCAEFVTLDTGTGVVHLAPAFGEDDFRAAKEQEFGFVNLIEPDGTFASDAGDFAGLFCKDADKAIMAHLKERGLLFAQSTYRHDYPFCPRAEQDPLIQYARRSWFIRTSSEKDRVVANNHEITWQPAHIRDGRMGDFLRNNVDWAISRERWWGTPLPIWINDESGAMDSVASIDEILDRNPDAFDQFKKAQKDDPDLRDDLMIHKPWIDEVTWQKDGEPGTYRRVPEVIDCWFDAGSMPFAQWGYPHQGQAEFKKAFPADFITEAVDQTRGWWNALLQISTLLFPDQRIPHPFKSCVVLGHVVDRKGYKLSKSKKNYEPPEEVLEDYGADSVRWALFTAAAPSQPIRFDATSAKEATRELLLKLWNVTSFFVTYARIDQWDGAAPRSPIAERAVLDRWILAELDATVKAVRAEMEDLDAGAAAREIQKFVDALSNWYVRRSRSRFWSEEDSDDKHNAFATLHEVLIETAKLLAPFAPFMAETLHQHLARPALKDAPTSVHLCDFPGESEERRDEELRHSMGLAREIVALGQRVRSSHNLKVRQPLKEAILVLAHDERLDAHTDIIREELNVHAVRTTDEPQKYVEFEIVPNFRALGPKLGKRMPLCKKCLQTADGSELYDQLESHGEFTITLGDGEPVTLSRQEVEVRLTEHEGYAASSAGGRVVVLDTQVTDELVREGLAREVINRIQTARKSMDLPYEARIKVVYAAEGQLAEAIEEHRDWIAGETLATRFEPGAPAGERHETEISETPFHFTVDT